MKLVIFDLDGTLIDSERDLVNAVNAARRHLGLVDLADHLIASYVGNGAPVLMRRALGPEAPEEQVQQALQFFLAYYREHMLDYTTLYPGVRDVVDRFRAAGVLMAVLTNKPVRISQAIVDGLGLRDHFQRVYGGNSFADKKPHPVGIETILSELGVERESAMMVGDSDVDILTARNAGVRSCGVTFGFKPESLREVAPDHLIDRMEELTPLVLGTG